MAVSGVHVDNNDVTFKTHHRIGMRASTPTIIRVIYADLTSW